MRVLKPEWQETRDRVRAERLNIASNPELLALEIRSLRKRLDRLEKKVKKQNRK